MRSALATREFGCRWPAEFPGDSAVPARLKGSPGGLPFWANSDSQRRRLSRRPPGPFPSRFPDTGQERAPLPLPVDSHRCIAVSAGNPEGHNSHRLLPPAAAIQRLVASWRVLRNSDRSAVDRRFIETRSRNLSPSEEIPGFSNLVIAVQLRHAFCGRWNGWLTYTGSTPPTSACAADRISRTVLNFRENGAGNRGGIFDYDGQALRRTRRF